MLKFPSGDVAVGWGNPLPSSLPKVSLDQVTCGLPCRLAHKVRQSISTSAMVSCVLAAILSGVPMAPFLLGSGPSKPEQSLPTRSFHHVQRRPPAQFRRSQDARRRPRRKREGSSQISREQTSRAAQLTKSTLRTARRSEGRRQRRLQSPGVYQPGGDPMLHVQ